MNEIKRIREIKGVLESLLKDELFTAIKEHRLSYLGTLEENLERLKTRSFAIDDDARLLPVLSEALEHFRETLSQKSDSTTADAYLNAVKRHTMDLPQEVMISQSEDRFKKLETDPAGVKLGKFVKREVRTVGTFSQGLTNFLRKFLDKPTKVQTTWIQKIPLQGLAEFHLCNNEGIFKDWIDKDHRLITTIITNLEEFLAKDFSSKKFCRKAKGHTDHFGDLVERLLSVVKTNKSELDGQLQDDFKKIQDDLFYYLERTDTLERRAAFYSKAKVDRESSHLRATLSEYVDEWDEVNRHLLSRAQTVDEFLSFKKELEGKSLEFLASMEDTFQSALFDPFASLRADIAGVHKKLQELEKKNNVEAAKGLLNDSKGLLTRFISKVRANLESMIESTELSLKSNLFVEHALLKANDISEHGLFVYDTEADKTPPSLDHRIIEWRILVVRALKEQLFNPLQPSKQHYEDFLVHIDADIQEVLEVIEVNIESAIELFETPEKGNNPFLIATEAFERTQSKLESNTRQTEEKLESIKLAVLDGGNEFCEKMINLIHEGDSKELQILDAKYKVKEKAQGWQTKGLARWARIQDSLTLFWRFGAKKTKEYVTAVRKFLGYKDEDVEQVEKADVATYLSETDSKISELPYIYRRLFNFDLEADRRFYVALNDNFGYLKKAYDSWEKGFPSTFAVVGEKGSGKSTYLNYALDDYFSKRELKKVTLTDVYYSEVDFIEFMKSEFGLEDIDSVDGIITAIRDTKKKKIIVIEGLQNFYLRHINGFGALEALLYVISETKDTIFWMISCSLYTWAFMDKTVSIGQYFSHIIRTDTLNEQQVESIIMNRHRSSGYELVFEPSNAQSKSRAYRKLMDKEEKAREYLREAYFEELTKLSDGNASIAMIFWVRSIREFDDTHFYIKPLEVTSLEMIQELKPDVLFTLATIVLHDSLTPKELSKILLFTEQESRLILIRLKTRGLLKKKEDRYFVNQLMYRQIVKTLKERNIIHLV